MKNILTYILVCISFWSFSADIYLSNRVTGSSINGTTFSITDPDYLLLPVQSSEFTDISPMGFVHLGVDAKGDALFYGNNLTVTVNFTVFTFDNLGVQTGSSNESLMVEYTEFGTIESIDMDQFRLPGIHKFNIRVNSISAVDNNGNTRDVGNQIYLESGFSSERYYFFDDQQSSPSIQANTISYNQQPTNIIYNATQTSATTDEIELAWNYVNGAEYYELEWTWVDNYDDGSINTIAGASSISMSESEFKRNSSRVRLSQQHFRIPQIFARGYLIYRVRAVGRWLDDTKVDKFGKWSSQGTGLLNVSDWNRIEIKEEHEKSLNWQYQATYAEDGKKKEVTQYFDGSLRNRQTVTRINSDNNAVVGETIYDNQGRGAIQILPAPTGSPVLSYYPGINKNVNNVAYSHRDFDWEVSGSTDCEITPASTLSTGSGASKYYSNDHTENNWQQYVADAEGYAFTQTQYTPDNTGRIRKQGGVGYAHRLGGGNETEYFYLQPAQEELNRLFGYKVGYKKRYKKNMVVDANGQVSVSYLDAQGRVVATAMQGDNLTPFNALESEQSTTDHAQMSVDLLGKLNSTDPDTDLDDNNIYTTGVFGSLLDGLKMSTQLGVVQDGSVYDFDYGYELDYYQALDCDNELTQGYSYVYDLKINLTDDCGQGLISENSVIGGFQIGANTITSYSLPTISQTLNQGSYTLTKDIVVNEQALENYLADYIANNPCVLSFDDFYAEPEVWCELSCSECLDELGTFESYIAVYGDDISAEQQATSLNEYNTLVDLCNEPCEVSTSCDAYYTMLMADVSPMGQYGAITVSTTGVTATDVLSVFNDGGNGLPLNNANWRYPTSAYKDEFGNISMVENTNGVLVAPEMLTLTEFINSWEASWAESIVAYHPEYALYEYQLDICNVLYEVPSSNAVNVGYSSDEFDQILLQNIGTFEQAQTNNYAIDFTTGTHAIFELDPYFNTQYSLQTITVNSNTYNNNDLAENLMLEKLLNYQGPNSMFAFSAQTALCGTNFSGVSNCQIPTDWTDLENNYSVEEQNAVWAQYKNNYAGMKSKINQLLMDFYGFSKTPGIYSECIGSGGYGYSFLGDFSYSSFLPEIAAQYIDLESLLFASNGVSALSLTLCSPFYDNKAIRIPRANGLIGGSGDPLTDINEAVAAADYNAWDQTGICPLMTDAQNLLSALAQDDALLTTTNTNNIAEFTLDMYTALGGSNPSTGSVTISGTSTSNTLSLDFNQVGMSPQNILTLSAVGSYSWNDYANTWFIYGVSNSYPTGNGNEVQVLIKAGANLASAEEYVVSYISSIDFNSCQLEYTANNSDSFDCDKKQNLESDLQALINDLIVDGDFVSNSIVDLSSNSIYNGSELGLNILDNNYEGSWEGSSTTAKIIDDLSNTLLTIVYDSPLPGDIIEVLSVSLNDNLVTFQFLSSNLNPNSPSSSLSTITATVTRSVAGVQTNLETNCYCEQTPYEASLQNLLNHLLDLVEDNIVPSGPYTCTELDELSAILGVTDLYLMPNYETYTPIIPCATVDNGYIPTQVGTTDYYLGFDIGVITNERFVTNCSISFTVPKNSDVSFQPSYDQIENLTLTAGNGFEFDLIQEITIADQNCAVTFENNSAHLTTGQDGCRVVDNSDCLDCEFQLQAPISCTESYPAYVSYFTQNITDNGIAFNSTNVPVSEEDFCQFSMAYILDAYLDYLTAFNVTDVSDLTYLTLQEFGSTAIGYHSANLVTAVNQYVQSGNTPLTLTWNEFASDDYMDENNICPTPGPSIEFPDTVIAVPCNQMELSAATVNAQNQYEIYLEQVAENFRATYIEGAMNSLVETFTESHLSKEYHYTLYYYDRAGNLTQTVPPLGVNRMDGYDLATNNAINQKRATDPESSEDPSLFPDHSFETVYRYNSLNQLVYQNTPDGGESRFAYDNLGRLILSQNAKQLVENQFSYTRYDFLGRVVEVGELDVSAQTYEINNIGRLQVVATGLEFNVNAQNFPSNLSTSREEVVHTFYDDFDFELTGTTQQLEVPLESNLNQEAPVSFENYQYDNTRNRITAVIYQEVHDFNLNNYQSASLYDYDVHGNVQELIQVIAAPELIALGQSTKHINYTYDLVSGNVNEVIYQKGKADEFRHKYCYDSDNRITNALTSEDGIVYEQDAKYFYYEHGPLARVEIGDDKVQSCDYAYTIQGWLKSVNGDELDENKAMGYDGKENTINGFNGRDAHGFTLRYYDDDYKATNNSMIQLSSNFESAALEENLYNGNIRAMVVALSDQDEEDLGSIQYKYQYDQLNRIKSMYGAELNYFGGNSASSSPTGYTANYTYDANGNIISLQRTSPADYTNEDFTATQFDDFSYDYTAGTNQLRRVSDNASNDGHTGNDLLTGQGIDNYTYDEIGQLIADEQEEIAAIEWKVNNKIRSITRTVGSDADYLEFEYDGMGNRIAKKSVNASDITKISYYFRDAQGNPMSIYTFKNITHNGSEEQILELSEREIYGSSRVGQEAVQRIIASSEPSLITNADPKQITVGDKRYELSNHLGNILEVITDRALPTVNNTENQVDYYLADVISYSDYYPFGMTMAGRTGDNDYRYGFQGQETDNEVKGKGNSVNYKYRMHDPRIGRFFAIDPLAGSYPHYSPYVFSGDKVIAWKELEGLEPLYNNVENEDGSITRVLNSADYSPVYTILLPQGQTAIIYENTNGAMAMDEADFRRVASFIAEGFKAESKNNSANSYHVRPNSDNTKFGGNVGINGINEGEINSTTTEIFNTGSLQGEWTLQVSTKFVRAGVGLDFDNSTIVDPDDVPLNSKIAGINSVFTDLENEISRIRLTSGERLGLVVVPNVSMYAGDDVREYYYERLKSFEQTTGLGRKDYQQRNEGMDSHLYSTGASVESITEQKQVIIR